MKYKAAIFDLDGTLINTDLYVVCNYTNLFMKYKKHPLPSLKEMVYFSGPPLTEVFKKYLPEFDPQLLGKDFLDFALKYENVLSSLYENEQNVLSNLVNSGIKLGLVTNKSKDACFDCLSHFNLQKYFSSIFYLERARIPKPDPSPILDCISELRVLKEECIYIGDDKYDIIASKKGNVDSILVKFGLKEGLEQYQPNYLANSYNDIERIIKYGK